MVSEGSGTSGQVGKGSFVEKVEEKGKKETPKGWTPFGLEEEVDEVLGTVAKTLLPRVVAAADVAVVAAADAAVVAAAVAIVVAAAVVVVVAAEVVVVFVDAERE